MKKTIIAVLCTGLLLSLCACSVLNKASDIKGAVDDIKNAAGDVAENIGNGANGDSDEEVDFNSIYSGGDDGEVLGKLSDEEKQSIIAQGKLAGVDVSFGADDSTTLVYDDGTTLIQSADGTWTCKNADGEVAQFGGGWPDNEFTQMLPEPELGTLSAVMTLDDSFSASFDGSDVTEMKAYVEKVIGKGFDVEPQAFEQTEGEGGYYSYTAQNADGWTFTAMSGDGQHSISLTKPSN